MPNHLNLDRLAAQRAQAIISRTSATIAEDNLSCQVTASEIDNTVTKTLGVLQENGLYACALFLTSRTDKEKGRAQVVLDEFLNLLSMLELGWTRPVGINSNQVLPFISNTVAVNLPHLLLAKETSEQMLVYARYGAKAQKNNEGEQ